MKSMKGNDIHIFCRIVAVANAMDGLMSVYQKRGLPIVAALAAIQQPGFNGMFDPVVLDAALRVIPPFRRFVPRLPSHNHVPENVIGRGSRNAYRTLCTTFS